MCDVSWPKLRKTKLLFHINPLLADRLNDETKRKCDHALEISIFTRSFRKEIVLRFLFKEENNICVILW